MMTNLFPAILLAGPPHSGKSVLSYMLSQKLRDQGIAHYLLRAVPDGEGDWFLESDPDQARILKLKHKENFTAKFVDHMTAVIQNRLLPLLVDIGGQPQGDQFRILKACTHSILLYRTEDEFDRWQEHLGDLGLLPVAELRSSQGSVEQIMAHKPVLQAVITGLERHREARREGPTFTALFERVAGICNYKAEYLEKEHLRRAPFPVLNESNLANELGISPQGMAPHWRPEHLAELKKRTPAGRPYALYGRGPVWLAAMLAAHALPAPAAIFDVRFGWVTLAEAGNAPASGLEFSVTPFGEKGNLIWVEILIPGGILEDERAGLPPLPAAEGIVLSGKLPRWTFAALARELAPRYTWVGVDQPVLAGAVIVHSISPNFSVGEIIRRP